MTWLIELAVALLRLLIPALVKAGKDTAEEAAPQPERKKRLRDRIRRTWGVAGILLLCILVMPGCFTRSVYVPSGEPVRLRETIKGAKVWIMGADGKPVEGKVDLEEGWFCLPDEEAGNVNPSPDSSLIVREPVEVLLEKDGQLIRLKLVPGTRIVFPDGIVPQSDPPLPRRAET